MRITFTPTAASLGNCSLRATACVSLPTITCTPRPTGFFFFQVFDAVDCEFFESAVLPVWQPGAKSSKATRQKFISVFIESSKFQPKAEAIQASSQAKNNNAATGGPGNGMSKTRLGEAPIPIAEMQQIKRGRKHFREEISQQHILSGDRQRFGHETEGPHIRDQVNNQPECCRDGAGPETPRRRGVVLTDAIKPVQQQRACGSSRDEQQRESHARAHCGRICRDQNRSQQQSADRNGRLRSECLANADEAGEPEIIERVLFVGGEKAKQQNHTGEQRGAMAVENQEGNRADKVRPADETEDAVPIGVKGERRKRDDALVMRAPESERKIDKSKKPEGADDLREFLPKLLDLWRASLRRDGAKREDRAKKHCGGPQRW